MNANKMIKDAIGDKITVAELCQIMTEINGDAANDINEAARDRGECPCCGEQHDFGAPDWFTVCPNYSDTFEQVAEEYARDYIDRFEEDA